MPGSVCSCDSYSLSAFDISIFSKHLWERQRKTTLFYNPEGKNTPGKKSLDVAHVRPRKVNRALLT